MRIGCAVGLALWVSTASAWAADPEPASYVWWEAESPAKTNFPAKTWFSASTFQDKRNAILSGGDWLTHAGERKGPEAFARYRVSVPADGQYNLWARKFWKHGPFRWRFDTQPWQTCGRDVGLADNVVIRKHLCVNWVYLGKVTLAKGRHEFELRLLAKPGEKQTACFDCFLLVPGPFTPRGKLKPGQKSGLAAPGFWALEPVPDAFGKAELDLRDLNESEAGTSGFVRREKGQFVRGDGKPLRFWGVNCGPKIVQLGPGSQEYLARRLAKVGVNLVRYHGPIFDRRGPDPSRVDKKFLDRLHRFVSILKKQGIYLDLSFYFPLWFDVRPSAGIPGYDTIANKKPFALLYFDPRMQRIYRSWARALLTTRNPYTGVPLGKEPAIAMVEIVNEDSYFFHTFSSRNIPAVQMRKLEALFGTWLKKKYGALARAQAAWGPRVRHKTDSPAEGRMGLFDAWHMTAKGHGTGGRKRRLGDQVRFLAEHQRAFYRDTVTYIRKELGSRSLIVCSNWKTADTRLLDPLERYTYTAGDVIDRHGYFVGPHKGPRSRFALDVGDTYRDRAGVLEPESLPIQFNQVADYPHVISEIGWPNPNRFKAEFPFLCSAYGSLQDVDGFMFFAVGGADWDAAPNKFPVMLPTVLGQFPAAALAYRRGDLSPGKVVVHDALRLEDLYAFKGGAAVTPQNLDELRKADVPPGGQASGKTVPSVDPLAFYVGQVLRRFDGDKSKAVLRDIRRFIDRDKKIVRSTTGQLAWDYGRGVVTMQSPRSQGATGFLAKAGRITLPNAIIESRNEFATVWVISLDDKPLAESKRILIQAMTEDRPYGWKAGGNRIAALGGYPPNVRKVDTVVTLVGNAGLSEVRTLDAHGYVRKRSRARATEEGLPVRLAPDAIYTVVVRGDE